MDSNALCKEVIELLKQDPIDRPLVTSKVEELKEALKKESWYSRKVDDIELPDYTLREHRFNQEALDILLIILDKEDCSDFLEDIYLSIGISYYYLGDYESAKKYLLKIEDDDDCHEEAIYYLEKMN